MIPPKKTGIVVMLDALGTKGRWRKTSDPTQIIETWDNLISSIKNAIQENMGKDKDPSFKISAFSDTVIITAEGADINKTLIYVGAFLGLFITQALYDKIFFRGCISYGDYYRSDNDTMIIGSAIDDAAEYYALPQWIGVSVTPSAYNILRKMTEIENRHHFFNPVFVKYDIPLKIGYEHGYAINLKGASDKIKEIRKEELEKIRARSTETEPIRDAANRILRDDKSIKELLEFELEGTNDISASMKIRNTLRFLE